MTFGLIESSGSLKKGRKVFFIYEGDNPSMRNWVGIVEFQGRNFKILPFKKSQTLQEQLALCHLCISKANEFEA